MANLRNTFQSICGGASEWYVPSGTATTIKVTAMTRMLTNAIPFSLAVLERHQHYVKEMIEKYPPYGVAGAQLNEKANHKSNEECETGDRTDCGNESRQVVQFRLERSALVIVATQGCKM